MLGKHKSFRGRSYINHAYNQKVDDDCLEYKSVPMAIVKEMLRPEIKVKNDYTGIKQIYNQIPARPDNISAMALSLARMSGQPISKVYDSILNRIADEEKSLVKDFVRSRSVSSASSESGYETDSSTYSTFSQIEREVMRLGEELFSSREYLTDQQYLSQQNEALRIYNESQRGREMMANESLILGNEPIPVDKASNDWMMEQSRNLNADRRQQAELRSFLSEPMPEGEGISRNYDRSSPQIFPEGEHQRSSMIYLDRANQARLRTAIAHDISKPERSYMRRAYNAGAYLTGEREEPPKTPMKEKVDELTEKLSNL